MATRDVPDYRAPEHQGEVSPNCNAPSPHPYSWQGSRDSSRSALLSGFTPSEGSRTIGSAGIELQLGANRLHYLS